MLSVYLLFSLGVRADVRNKVSTKFAVVVTTNLFIRTEEKIRKKKEENKNEHDYEDRCIVTVHR